MSTYDNPLRREHPVSVANMATATVTRVIRGKKGHKGRLDDILFSCVTQPAGAPGPRVQVGVIGNLTQFADWDLTTAAAGNAPAPNSSAVASAAPAPNVAIKRDANYSKLTLPADTDIIVTVTQASGAGAAGGGDVMVYIDWY